MKILAKPTEIAKFKGDLLFVFSFKGPTLEGVLDSSLISKIKSSAVREEFEGDEGTPFIYSMGGDSELHKIVVFGLGEKSSFEISSFVRHIASSIRLAKKMKAKNVGFVFSDEIVRRVSHTDFASTITQAVLLGSYTFDKYKGDDQSKKMHDLDEVSLLVSPGRLSSFEKGIDEGVRRGLSTFFARDLVNEPPDITTPSYLADTALTIAKKSEGRVKATIFSKEECKKMGMNAFLGVAKGSDEDPKFIHLSYKGKRARKKVVLIGKGITFDTGGLSLKPAEHMETMKLDMAGAAAVLGVFEFLSKYDDMPVNVVGLVAACENMPSGRALRPGDILKAMNGKTIEVLNTDAEGRLTLADAISYAVMKEKPDAIIDLATLTGACMVALGEEIAGLMGNNDALLSSLEKSSHETGEMLWRLPLPKEYKKLIKSHIADLRNISHGRYGGAITAGLFLEEFTDGIPWAHLDIAGPAYEEKPNPLSPIGGTGYGVRLLLSYLKSL